MSSPFTMFGTKQNNSPLPFPCRYSLRDFHLHRASRGRLQTVPRAEPVVSCHSIIEIANSEITATPNEAVYIGLGLTLVSFLLTFGVAPRFKSAFKEEDTWRDIYTDLVENYGGVESISPTEACKRVEKGAFLMDVRLARKFEVAAMQHSYNFQLYQPISGWGLASNIRRAGFAFFGIYGTERNRNWLKEVEAIIPKGSPSEDLVRNSCTEVIVACEQGGSLETKLGAETGFQSRSLKASYYLKKAGYKYVTHLKDFSRFCIETQAHEVSKYIETAMVAGRKTLSSPETKKGGVAEYSRTVGDLIPGDEVRPVNMPKLQEVS